MAKPATLAEHPNVGSPLRWVNEGITAWVPLADGRYLLAECVCAAGVHGRFKNERHSFEQWRDIRDCLLYVPMQHKES